MSRLDFDAVSLALAWELTTPAEWRAWAQAEFDRDPKGCEPWVAELATTSEARVAAAILADADRGPRAVNAAAFALGALVLRLRAGLLSLAEAVRIAGERAEQSTSAGVDCDALDALLSRLEAGEDAARIQAEFERHLTSCETLVRNLLDRLGVRPPE